MGASESAQIERLFWIFLPALGAVVAAIVLLVRSGRTVPPPWGGTPRRGHRGAGR